MAVNVEATAPVADNDAEDAEDAEDADDVPASAVNAIPPPPKGTASPEVAPPAGGATPAAKASSSSAAKSSSTSPSVRLFSTVEFKGPVKSLPVWLSVLDRNKKNAVFEPAKKLGTSTWADLKGKLENMSPMEQLRAVNRFWNQWPYRQDTEVYKKSDYWAIPAEFVKNSGDCEDYSIAKYFTLKELGFDPDKMRIVVLMETIRNIAHAILVVYIDGDAFVLDNLSNTVLSHTRYRNYLPQYSVNERFRWAHVKPKK